MIDTDIIVIKTCFNSSKKKAIHFPRKSTVNAASQQSDLTTPQWVGYGRTVPYSHSLTDSLAGWTYFILSRISVHVLIFDSYY